MIALYYSTYQHYIRLKNKPSIFDIKVFEIQIRFQEAFLQEKQNNAQ